MASTACFTKHLYEKTEVQLSFQCAALTGDAKEAVYWLLELCESGWIAEAWEQLWIAFYDFYAAHNPQFEGELLELMKLSGKRGQLRMIPLLHGASALIGRRRSIAAWLLRQGVLARVDKFRKNSAETAPSMVSISLGGDGAVIESGDESEGESQAEAEANNTILERLLSNPVEAADALAENSFEYSDLENPKLWEIYEELVDHCDGDAQRATWDAVPASKLHIVCALLVFVNEELSVVHNENNTNIVDLTAASADRELVNAALDLLKKTKSTPPRDHLLLWRQYSPRREIGSLVELPRWKEGKVDELAKSLRYGHNWMKFTGGCPYWTRTVRAYNGKRGADGQVIWADEEAEERFYAEGDYDTEELPMDVHSTGANLFPKGTKLQWLKKVWNVKPRPELWNQLLQP